MIPPKQPSKLRSYIDLRGEKFSPEVTVRILNRQAKCPVATSPDEGLLLGIATSGGYVLEGYRCNGGCY